MTTFPFNIDEDSEQIDLKAIFGRKDNKKETKPAKPMSTHERYQRQEAEKEKLTQQLQKQAEEEAKKILKDNKQAIKRPILLADDVDTQTDEALLSVANEPEIKTIPEVQVDDTPENLGPTREQQIQAVLEEKLPPVTEDMYSESTEAAKERIMKEIAEGKNTSSTVIDTTKVHELQQKERDKLIKSGTPEELRTFLVNVQIKNAEAIRNVKIEQELRTELEKKAQSKKRNKVKKAPSLEVTDTIEEGAYTQEEEAEAEQKLVELAQGNQSKAVKKTKETAEETELKLPFDDGLTIEEAARLMLQEYMTPDYVQYKKDILNRLYEITIDPDLNTGTLKYKVHQIDALRAELIAARINAKEMLNSLMNKEYGTVAAYMSTNAIGSNAEERKKAGYRALENFTTTNGKHINLSKLFTGVRMRADFIESVIQELENKQNILITYSAALKIDASLEQ